MRFEAWKKPKFQSIRLLPVVKKIFWKNYKNRKTKNKSFPAVNLHIIVLCILVSVFIAYYTFASFLRYDNFHTGRFDLGNMTQTVWNTAHGRIFQFTNPDGQEILSRLAFHADFILVLFAPLYWIWESPKVLLLFQAIILGLGAFFIYLLSETILKNKHISLSFSFAYLINPALSWSVLFDFHSVVLATTFLLGAIYFLIKRRFVWFLIFALLAAITKEQIWFIIALFGPILFFYHKKRLLGFLVFAISLCIFYLLLWYVIPHTATSHGHFALTYFADGGSSPSDLIKNIVSSPSEAIAKISDEERTGYLKALFIPLGYLPILFPFWLIFPSADFALNLLSDKEELHYIYYHYTAAITPFLFVSAIFAIYYVKKYIKKYVISSFAIVFYILFFAVYGAYTYGPLPGTLDPSLDTLDSFTKPLAYKEEIKAKLAQIPIDASVAATNNLGGYLSHREKIYTTATDVRDADFVAFLLRDTERDEDSLEIIEILKKDPNFVIWYQKYGLSIFKKIIIEH